LIRGGDIGEQGQPMPRTFASTRASSSRPSTSALRCAVAERAADLELCLTLVCVLLARRELDMAPAASLIESAMASWRHGAKALRAVVNLAADALEAGSEIERTVLAATRRAVANLARAQLRYRAALRHRAERTPFEPGHLKMCVEDARAAMRAMASEPYELTVRASGVWATDGSVWGDERPGVHRVQPRERLESGVRFATAIAVGDDER
jgi:hypothetical protein